MPLPDTSLSLIHATLQSKPKRAMIVRMSAETLDALDTNTQLSVDFGDVPGIYIGDAFFPMRPQKESSPHELYLRIASKPLAPLKLHANVIGKFMVERQLGDKVTDKVRHQTLVAKQQHLERQTIRLDQPPILPTKHKRKPLASGVVPKKTSPHAAAPQRKVSPLPQPTKANADLRRRLVHFLAIEPRLAEDTVKMVGGASISTSARDDLLALLDQIAEQPPAKKGDKSPRLWTLKPQSWTEVRPYEWPKLAESTRTNMARQARMKLKDLGIPDSDPAWDHVRYRPTAPTIPAPPPVASSSSNKSSTSAQADTKRSAITTKDSKQKSKPPKDDIQIKDESTRVRPDTTKRAEADRSEAVKSVASRRLPGSGYQVKKSPQPSSSTTERHGTPTSHSTPLPPKPPPGSYGRKTIPTIPPKSVKKEDESDREREREIDRQREREREREREKRVREKERERDERERERVELEKRERLKQKERERRQRDKEREREREREEMEQEKRQREKERNSKENATGSVQVFKRKTVLPDVEDSIDDASSKALKRRKLDDGTVATSSKVRDAVSSRKSAHEPSPVPRLKMKKDPSPQAPISQDRRAITSASTHKPERPSKASGSVKRRRSPIYTSSEDEGEIPQPRKRKPSPPPASERSISSDRPPSDRLPHRRTRVYPPSSDPAALRSLYKSRYVTYMSTFSKVIAQKHLIEAMLNGESEAEMDVLDPEELMKLSMEHKSLKNELEHILDIYSRGRAGAVAASD